MGDWKAAMYAETATPPTVPKKVLVTIAGALAVLALVAVVDHGETSPTLAATELSSPPAAGLIADEGSDEYLTSTAYVSSRCAMQNDEDELNAGASHNEDQTWCKDIKDPSHCASAFVNVWKQKTTAPCVWVNKPFEQNGKSHHGDQCSARETCKAAELDAEQAAAAAAREIAAKDAKEAAQKNDEEKAEKAKKREEEAAELTAKANARSCQVIWYVPKPAANRLSGPWGSSSGKDGPRNCNVKEHCPHKTPEECCAERAQATHKCVTYNKGNGIHTQECGGQCVWR